MSAIPIATFHDLEPAKQLREMLQQAGIPATLRDESKVDRFWFMSEPLAAIHVEVPQPQYLAARQYIQQRHEAGKVLEKAVHCPECNSSRVEFPQLTRKFMMPVLIGKLLAAFKILPREFYCQDCHYTWPLVPRQSQVDGLWWWLRPGLQRSKKV